MAGLVLLSTLYSEQNEIGRFQEKCFFITGNHEDKKPKEGAGSLMQIAS